MLVKKQVSALRKLFFHSKYANLAMDSGRFSSQKLLDNFKTTTIESDLQSASGLKS